MTTRYIVNPVTRQASSDCYGTDAEALAALRDFGAGFYVVVLTDEQAADIFHPETGFNTDF